MKGEIRSGLKLVAVLLAAATLAFNQTSMPASVPQGSTSSAAGYSHASTQPRQGVPGTINYIEGRVMLNGQPLGLNAADRVVAQPNQSIQTQAGYVEILLTPGAFLRIGHYSEVVPQSLGLANMQLQVVHGSAMIEVADLVHGVNVSVNMNGSTTQIEKRGLYEFDANQQLVRVLDGKAKVLEPSGVKSVGKGDQLVLANANFKPHGFDKRALKEDPLYVWSKVRSETEAEANVTAVRNVAAYGGWYGAGWYWDPFWAEYAFLPGAGCLYSPFGWGFYSPAFIYAAPFYSGFYGHPFYAHRYYRSGVSAAIRGHSGGFHGGVHGAGGRR